MTFWRKWLPSKKPAAREGISTSETSRDHTNENEAFVAELENIGWFSSINDTPALCGRRARCD
jgi:hypothetical protein